MAFIAALASIVTLTAWFKYQLIISEKDWRFLNHSLTLLDFCRAKMKLTPHCTVIFSLPGYGEKGFVD